MTIIKAEERPGGHDFSAVPETSSPNVTKLLGFFHHPVRIQTPRTAPGDIALSV
jgi:hypothetical protein